MKGLKWFNCMSFSTDDNGERTSPTKLFSLNHMTLPSNQPFQYRQKSQFFTMVIINWIELPILSNTTYDLDELARLSA